MVIDKLNTDKLTVVLIATMMCFYCTIANAQKYSDSISVNFFLLDECRISQKMSSYINEIYSEYQDSDQFYFEAFFPNRSTSSLSASVFMKEYNILMPYRMDHEKIHSKKMKATTLPQVVINDEKHKKILYSGRVNNLFNRIGSRRRVITSNDLKNALQSILDDRRIKNSNTKAIGCIINYNENEE